MGPLRQLAVGSGNVKFEDPKELNFTRKPYLHNHVQCSNVTHKGYVVDMTSIVRRKAREVATWNKIYGNKKL